MIERFYYSKAGRIGAEILSENAQQSRAKQEKKMNKPYIICHMTVSDDGKTTGEFLRQPECESSIEEYYRIHREFEADGFICGRITMEESFTRGEQADLSAFAGAEMPTEDHIARSDAKFYAVALDRKGSLGWKTAEVEDDDPGYGGAHIIEVVTEQASAEYLAYLRSIGVSYIIAGSEEMDIELALDKLYEKFGIRKLLLEGGNTVNHAFVKAGVIDELSILKAPIMEGSGKPFFEDDDLKRFYMQRIQLVGKNMGSVWIKYGKIS